MRSGPVRKSLFYVWQSAVEGCDQNRTLVKDNQVMATRGIETKSQAAVPSGFDLGAAPIGKLFHRWDEWLDDLRFDPRLTLKLVPEDLFLGPALGGIGKMLPLTAATTIGHRARGLSPSGTGCKDFQQFRFGKPFFLTTNLRQNSVTGGGVGDKDRHAIDTADTASTVGKAVDSQIDDTQ